MPALLPVWVIPPVSPCTDAVRVQGQLSKSTVTIFADGNVVGEGVAPSADALIRLSQPVTPGQQITATQTLDGDTSPVTPLPVTVQSEVTELGAPGVGSVQRCSSCMLVFGVLPGARTTVRDTQGTLRGEASDSFLTLHVPIEPSAAPDERLEIRQETAACGISDDILVEATGAPPATLPPPGVVQPLRACNTSLRVFGGRAGGAGVRRALARG